MLQKELMKVKEQKEEYKVGKIETKTINAQGELNKITASVAIDGNLDAIQTKNVKNMVANTIGMKKGRGDNVVVVGMNFNTNDAINATKADKGVVNVLKTTGYIVGAILLLIAIALITMFIIKKRNQNKDDDFDGDAEIDLINQKLEEMEKNRLSNGEEDEESITLEDEVRIYASENPDQVTELIKSWLNE